MPQITKYLFPLKLQTATLTAKFTFNTFPPSIPWQSSISTLTPASPNHIVISTCTSVTTGSRPTYISRNQSRLIGPSIVSVSAYLSHTFSLFTITYICPLKSFTLTFAIQKCSIILNSAPSTCNAWIPQQFKFQMTWFRTDTTVITVKKTVTVKQRQTNLVISHKTEAG